MQTDTGRGGRAMIYHKLYDPSRGPVTPAGGHRRHRTAEHPQPTAADP